MNREPDPIPDRTNAFVEHLDESVIAAIAFTHVDHLLGARVLAAFSGGLLVGYFVRPLLDARRNPAIHPTPTRETRVENQQ
jgi:hypothetical protein